MNRPDQAPDLPERASAARWNAEHRATLGSHRRLFKRALKTVLNAASDAPVPSRDSEFAGSPPRPERRDQAAATRTSMATDALARTQAALARADSWQHQVRAFVELHPELALAAARRIETGSARDELPLAGMTLAVKDLINLAGAPTRLGTPRAGHRHPTTSATVASARFRRDPARQDPYP